MAFAAHRWINHANNCIVNSTDDNIVLIKRDVSSLLSVTAVNNSSIFFSGVNNNTVLVSKINNSTIGVS